MASRDVRGRRPGFVETGLGQAFGRDGSGLARRAFDLAAQLGACKSVAQIAEIFGDAIAPLDMTAYACGMVTGPRAAAGNVFHFAHWPAEWLKVYQDNDFAKIDPIPRWAIVSGAAVSWSEVIRSLPAKDAGHRVVTAGRAHHFTEGYVTPVRTIDGHLGLVSVGGERGEFTEDEKLYLQTISTAALVSAEALLASPERPRVSILTEREMECAMLLCQGLTDRQIAAALKLSTSTARFHVDNARRKMGAKSRAHLANMVSGRAG